MGYIVHGVAKSQTCTMHFITMKDTMHCITTEDKYLVQHLIWIKPCVVTYKAKIG